MFSFVGGAGLIGFVAGVLGQDVIVSTQWLSDRLDDRSLVVIHTAMSRSEYDASHIPNARFISHQEVLGTRHGIVHQLPPVDEVVAIVERVGVSHDSRVVIYGSPQLAARLFFTLAYVGLADQTSVLNGGLEQWRAEGRPVTAAVPTVARSTFEPRIDESVVVGADWVHARLDDPTFVLLDVRRPSEFAGDERMRGDVRSGHIPGAVNLEWHQFMSADVVFKDEQSLREQFTRIGFTDGRTIVAYCQIGMRASVAYLVARHLGYPVTMYDGSMVEWSQRRDLPIER